MKMLDEVKKSQNDGFEGYDETTTGLIKVFFENSVMQRH
jgi:hypothetical protein